MKQYTVQMTLDKETRNTIRFAEAASDGPPVLGTIYVPKWVVGDVTEIVVTLAPAAAAAPKKKGAK